MPFVDIKYSKYAKEEKGDRQVSFWKWDLLSLRLAVNINVLSIEEGTEFPSQFYQPAIWNQILQENIIYRKT